VSLKICENSNNLEKCSGSSVQNSSEIYKLRGIFQNFQTGSIISPSHLSAAEALLKFFWNANYLVNLGKSPIF
jgi:hypothetical protein